MTLTYRSAKPLFIVYGLPLLVILISAAIAISPLIEKHPDLAIGITYDLTLTAPLLFLILSWKSNFSKLRAVPFFIMGTLIASYLLPENGQSHLNLIKTYAIPAVELFVLGILILKIRKGIRTFKAHSDTSSDFYTICKKSAIDLVGPSRLASFLSSEVSMLYYALIAWKKPKMATQTFTHYKENGVTALAGALLMIVCIETLALHFLLAQWSLIVAWLLTATSIYTALAIFAHLKALRLRPSVFTDKEIVLRNGLLADISIPFNNIERAVPYTKEMKSQTLQIGNLGLAKESTDHNLAIHFKEPLTIQKMYGLTETCDVLLLHVDDRENFLSKLTPYLKSEMP